MIYGSIGFRDLRKVSVEGKISLELQEVMEIVLFIDMLLRKVFQLKKTFLGSISLWKRSESCILSLPVANKMASSANHAKDG